MTQTVNRNDVLTILSHVSVGLGSHGYGGYFVFRDKTVTAFNEDIIARGVCDLGFDGVVPSKQLLHILEIWTDEHIEIEVDGHMLKVRGGSRRRCQIPMEDVADFEPFDYEFGDDWLSLNPEFGGQVMMIAEAAATGKEVEHSYTRCVHITPTGMEATDLNQYARIKTKIPVKENHLIRKDCIPAIMRTSPDAIAESEHLLCFRNSLGIEVGIVRQEDEFPSAEHILADIKDYPELSIPAEMKTMLQAASGFSSQIQVELDDRWLYVRAESESLYEERKRVRDYQGEPVAFCCDVVLLSRIVDCGRMRVAPLPEGYGLDTSLYRLMVQDGKYTYIVTTSALSAADEEDEEPSDDEGDE